MLATGAKEIGQILLVSKDQGMRYLEQICYWH